MIINNNLKNLAGLFLATLVAFSGYSQEAKNIYHKEYSKLSFVFQPSILKKSDAWNRDGSTYASMDSQTIFYINLVYIRILHSREISILKQV